jgi:hypothetical protein
VETLEELRALQRDLAGLGDAVAVALLERAEKAFLGWQFVTPASATWSRRSDASRSRSNSLSPRLRVASPATSLRARWRSHDWPLRRLVQ